MLSIGITTFKRRYNMVENLIKQIRSFDEDISILITVNADYKTPFDEEYRKNITNLASNTQNCFPFVFPTFTSLSKMWNTIIVNAPTDYVLVLNDDIDLASEKVLQELKEIIKDNNPDKIAPKKDLFTINKSWSHFVISKQIAHKLKYFDERLLAFGEEDGDMYWRFIKQYGFEPKDITLEGILNVREGCDKKIENIEMQNLCGSQRPVFNRKWLFLKKYKKFPFGLKGLFDYKVISILSDKQQYPYEEFKRKNYDKI
jgi:hypothetical protein